MKCAKCGKTATKYNADGVSVCSRHSKTKIAAPPCPECRLTMVLRKSKYGVFWGCSAFPLCDGIKKI